MLYLQRDLPDGSTLGIWKITESPDELSENFSKKLLKDARFAAIKNEKRKREWLAVRLLLKTLLGDEAEIAYEESGKPFLIDRNFNISISHTDNYAAILLHSTRQTGIDIEKTGERAFLLKERFMSADELRAIDARQPEMHALLHWSAKETLYKILQKQAVDFVADLHIQAFDLQKEGSFSAFETRSALRQRFTVNYVIFDEFVLTRAIA